MALRRRSKSSSVCGCPARTRRRKVSIEAQWRLLREYAAIHSMVIGARADGQALHRQPFRGDPQGDAGEGPLRNLSQLCSYRLPEHRRAWGQAIIVPDGETAPVLQELYARFAPGTLSLEALVAQRPRESRCGAGRWARVWRIKSCASGCTWANSIGTG
jgi:hypothetical protein